MCDAKMDIQASTEAKQRVNQAGSGQSPTRSTDSDMPADLYSGTAEAYARYRPAHPDDLLDDLRQRAGVTGEGRLLDMACGPGRVTIPLTEFFGEVWAVDQEPEMIEVGRARAKRKGVTNIRWMVGRAEDVEAAPGSFELITIGEAFHRLDQGVVADQAFEWLVAGRCLATLGCFGLMAGQEPWHDVLRAAVGPWTDRGAAAQSTSARRSQQTRGTDHERAVLTGHGFEHVGSFDFPRPHVWTVDSILGNLRSTARYSTRALGDEVERFDADVRSALVAFDSSGRYPETLRFGYSLFRRPIQPGGRV